MKKNIFKLAAIMAIGSLVFLACEKKKDDTIHPTYISEAPGSSGNPNPNYVPVSTTNTNTPATENSNLAVGGAGWSNLTCITTNSLYLKCINGNNEVVLQFSAPPAVGTFTYNIASVPGNLSCALVVTGDPNQPAGTIWYGYEGSVSVTTTTNAVNAIIVGSVKCRQSTFNFPVVSVSGVLGCN